MIGYLRAVGIKANLRFMQFRRAARRHADRQGGRWRTTDLGLVLDQRRVRRGLRLLQGSAWTT